MRLLICDDDIEELKNIEKIISEYSAAHFTLMIETSYFSNPFELLEDINKNGTPDIVLLDIYMPGILGTEVAREILSRDDNGVDIIFLTTSTDFAVEAFALHVRDYISKPYDVKRLTDTLDRVFEKRKKRLFIPIQCGKEIYRIDLQNVLYAESKNHVVEIHLKSGNSLKTRTPLTKLMESFKDAGSFYLVGASYIVNFIYVQGVLQTTLEMTNGDKIPVPRRLRSEMQKQYFDFYTKEATQK